MFSNKKLQIIIAFFTYIAITAGVFWDPLVNKFGSIQWDAISVHFFNLLFSSQAWHTGVFPLWTPYIFNGFPQVADPQVAIFYPINSLIGIFSVFTADLMQYQIVLHYFLAAFFAFLLAKKIGGGFLISIACGTVYAFGGFMTAHGSHIGMQNTATWLPLIFLLLIIALQKSKIAYGILCGFFFGIAILAGHFQMALYGAYFTCAYIAYDIGAYIIDKIRERSTQKTIQIPPTKQFFAPNPNISQKNLIYKKITVAFSIFLVAFFISTIQLLPTFELTQLSQRAEISLDVSQTESLNPDSLWGLIYPNHNNVSYGDPYTGPWDRTQNYLYLGFMMLVLAGAGAIKGIVSKKTRKITAFFIAMATASLIYSFGKYGFLQEYFYYFIPFADKVRAPANMMLIFNLSIVCLVAILPSAISDLWENKWKHYKIPGAIDNRPKLKTALTTTLAIAATLFVITSIYMATVKNELLYAKKESGEITKEPWIAQNIISEYSALDEINKFQVFKIPEFSDNSTQMRQIYSFDGYNPLALSRHGKFIDAMVKNANLIDLAGIKYLPCKYIVTRAENMEKAGDLCINPRYFPRALFVDNLIIAKNGQEALEKLNQIEDFSKIAVLEEAPEEHLKHKHESINKKIIITDTKPGIWKIETQNDSDSFLLLNQTNYPGWKATVGGHETKIYQANYLFQAIFVPAGDHKIVFQFESRPLKNGAILTIIGLITSLIAVIYIVFEKKIAILWEKYYQQ